MDKLQILMEIQKMDGTELDAVLHAVMVRYRMLFPDWENVYFSYYFLIKFFNQEDITFGAVDSDILIIKISESRLIGFSYQKLQFCELKFLIENPYHFPKTTYKCGKRI